MVRVAINGFGRIGRMAFRLGWAESDIEWVGINELGDTKTAAHLLKYDSVHGKMDVPIEARPNELIVAGDSIPFFSEKDPASLPWKKLNVDVVLECTGVFTTREACQKHILAGAKKVILSAPGKDESIPSIVLGVNEDPLRKGETIMDNASCTTNCLAPVVKVLQESFGIQKGFMTTIHAYTNDQRILDAPHKDLRRARNAATNLIPTSTGAAKAIGKAVPALKGKMDGISIRAPVMDGSLVDLVCVTEKNTTVEEVNAAFKKAAQGALKEVLEYCSDPIVSSDVIGNRHSAVFDSLETKVIGGNLVKVLAWYDNEIGYSQRLVDLLKRMK
ncbi:MAG: type I glyceraldehyde-3-phosphate dehydrogenase [Candidatus Diapherotrites archaeon]|nr:type I glyceraldehyde-3-phosphate dehydrogenase [Candidatus Diapherotrites archaeon]